MVLSLRVHIVIIRRILLRPYARAAQAAICIPISILSTEDQLYVSSD